MRRLDKECRATEKKIEALKLPPNCQHEMPIMIKAYLDTAVLFPKIFSSHKTIKKSLADISLEDCPTELFEEITNDIIKAFKQLTEQFTVKDNYIKIHQHLVDGC
jgi:hypothetical protein